MFKSITFLQKRIKLYLRVNYFLLLLKDIGVMGSVMGLFPLHNPGFS